MKTVTLSAKGITQNIKELERWHKRNLQCCNKLVKALAQRGVEIAEVRFANAPYTGVNDVEVKATYTSEREAVITANGDTVLFIEFGTGITYPRIPDGDMFGAGSYGSGRGKQKTWYFTGSGDGTYAKPTPNGKAWYTHGIPASGAMRETHRLLPNELENLAKECFK